METWRKKAGSFFFRGVLGEREGRPRKSFFFGTPMSLPTSHQAMGAATAFKVEQWAICRALKLVKNRGLEEAVLGSTLRLLFR